MYGQFEILRMAREAERQALNEQERKTCHLREWQGVQQPPLRAWLSRRPHIRTVTIRLPLPVLASPRNRDACG